jgi:phytoene dehydrogenase-like protein
MQEIYDFLIIGAGASGLAISSLLQKDGQKTITLEAHSLLGGSSSYFYRGHYSFDVGATTLSGIKNNGPLASYLKLIDLDLELKKIDPGIIVRINNKEIKHFSDQEKFLNELVNAFNTISPDSFKKFIIENHAYDNLGYQAIAHNKLPKRSLSKFYEFISLNNLNYVSLLKLLNKSYYDFISKDLQTNEDFRNMLSEMLFITAQNNIFQTPALFGILGINYPNDTYYMMGGMKSFSDKLKSKAGPIKTNHKVLSIIKKESHFEVTTEKNKFLAKNVISTLPRINNELLFNPTYKPIEKESWSAFTLYFTVPTHIKIDSLYYQIHIPKIPHLNTKSYFCSFSHPEDLKRNFNGRHTVTISTHAMPSIFSNLDKIEYEKIKNEIGNYILDHFLKSFHLNKEEIENLEFGTPKTFEKYTNRFQGSVGGIGHDLSRNLLKMIYLEDREKNFYALGDTTFPGQGIAAVIYGATSLYSALK